MQAFGYLLRKLPEKNLPEAMCHVLEEVAASATEARIHGAAYLIAESVLGPANRLHSCASTLLDTLLAQGILQDGSSGESGGRHMQTSRTLPNHHGFPDTTTVLNAQEL